MCGMGVPGHDRRAPSRTNTVDMRRESGGDRCPRLLQVPTATFRLLYCLFVIEHERRRILHFNVTPHPTADWVNQQLRKAFPGAGILRTQ
jgi:hypothetical protein